MISSSISNNPFWTWIAFKNIQKVIKKNFTATNLDRISLQKRYKLKLMSFLQNNKVFILLWKEITGNYQWFWTEFPMTNVRETRTRNGKEFAYLQMCDTSHWIWNYYFCNKLSWIIPNVHICVCIIRNVWLAIKSSFPRYYSGEYAQQFTEAVKSNKEAPISSEARVHWKI